MQFTVDQTDLAAAVSYAAHSLPAKPPAPVLAGLLLTATKDGLRVSAFDYETSSDTTIAAAVTGPGRALVSGRLLTDIASRVRGTVRVELAGPRLILTAGSARFTLPTLPLEDYPQLPDPGTGSGTLPGPALAEAVTQVATALGSDDALPILSGISLHHDQDAGTLTLTATDRYRFAVRILAWKRCDLTGERTALAPGKKLLDAVKACADDPTVDLTLPGDSGTSGLFTVRSDNSTSTLRAIEGSLPAYRTLFPTEFAHTATVEIGALKEAVQRVALVAVRSTPVRLTFTADGSLVLEAGSSDDAQAVDTVDTALRGDELNVAFNPGFLVDGLTALTLGGATAVDFQFTSSTKPAVLRGHDSDEHALRYMLMPVRLTD
ncbi:DNA polymerase III subunit beta (plasmid) [Streptomyces sp. BH-SS-21]|uniref:Beta sliding clamp n=1 Tax=Streptomyces liliiviolaceus TaxID=2823109 RepID=A0A940Y9I4_9ACTN|nr:DNA polymerase III subunit beta [Streptomyces liliiviolaceus]MBQ0855741.1 DNA polymerase III subunit beta [Streptomyces liliiviolaceus]